MLYSRVLRKLFDESKHPRDENGRWATAAHLQAHFPIEKDLRNAVKRMADAGYKVWVVGGAVRDFLSGKEPHDIDGATDAPPEETMRVFGKQVKFDAGGQAHGVVRVQEGKTIFELTTLRHDVETDGKHAKVSFTTNIVDDLQRRDLTVNALAFDPATGELWGPGKDGDPTQALEDLKNHVIRFVGNGHQRIVEDRSRALRAVRFAIKLNSDLSPETMRDIKTAVASGLLDDRDILSAEAIRKELLRTLSFPDGGRGLRLWKETGMLYRFFPELKAAEFQAQNHHHAGVQVLEHIFRTVERADVPDDVPPLFDELADELGVSRKAAARAILRLTMLMHDSAKPLTAKEKPGQPGEYSFIGHEGKGAELADLWSKQLKMTNRMTALVVAGVKEHMAVPHPNDQGEWEETDSSIRRWARRLAEENKALVESGLDIVGWMLAIREADWTAQGRAPKDTGAAHIRAKVAEALSNPTKPAISGDIVMRLTGLTPKAGGRTIGAIIKVVAEYKDAHPKASDAELEQVVLETWAKMKAT